MPIELRIYLVPADQPPTGTAMITRIQPGRSPSVDYATDPGAHDIVVTVPATEWSFRTPAVVDGSEILVVVDGDACG